MLAMAALTTNFVDFAGFKETLAIKLAVINLVAGGPNPLLCQIEIPASTFRTFAAGRELFAHAINSL
jgi:hypothetical protein